MSATGNLTRPKNPAQTRPASVRGCTAAACSLWALRPYRKDVAPS